MNKINWRKYCYEFLSIFVAVLAALGLNNWNDNRRAQLTEIEILTEISRGLEQDLSDIQENMRGHRDGIAACSYIWALAQGRDIGQDSFPQKYFELTRDFISIQNQAGYKSLQSIGLDIIQNEDLRFKIISIYEYDFGTLKKLEEEYAETQFHANYYPVINQILSPHFIFGNRGQLSLNLPLNLDSDDKNLILSYLWRIQINRNFVLASYGEMEAKILSLIDEINALIQ